MKDFPVQIMQFMAKECVVPIVITAFGFLIEHKIVNRAERKKAAPNMYIMKLNGKRKIKINGEKIRKTKCIIELSFQGFFMPDSDEVADKTIKFEEITYNELLERVDKYEMVLIGFSNLVMNGLSLNHVMDRQGGIYDFDENVVPIFIDEDTNYCLAFRKEYAPVILSGSFLERPAQYEIKGHDCVVYPRMKKG